MSPGGAEGLSFGFLWTWPWGGPEGSLTAPCGHWKVPTGGSSVFSCSQVGFQASLNGFQVALEACPPLSHFVLPPPVLVGFVPVSGAAPVCDALLKSSGCAIDHRCIDLVWHIPTQIRTVCG